MHGRYHRGQFGQPGYQQECRVCRYHIRWKYPVTHRRLLLLGWSSTCGVCA